MLGSRVLALWWGINGFISTIIGLGVRFGVSPLGTSGHANGVPSRGINPRTLKTIHLITAIDVYLESLKTQTYPALKDEACPAVINNGSTKLIYLACESKEHTLINSLMIENSAFTMGNKVSKLPYLSPSLGFRVSDLLSRLQVVILIVIPFRRIIGPPVYSGLHLSSGGSRGGQRSPRSPSSRAPKIKP